jgi:Tfp pilus assembly protein PilX
MESKKNCISRTAVKTKGARLRIVNSSIILALLSLTSAQTANTLARISRQGPDATPDK